MLPYAKRFTNVEHVPSKKKAGMNKGDLTRVLVMDMDSW
jgi:hypothetical protein